MTTILGIKINKLTRAELLAKIDAFLNSDKNHYLVTPNPEIILKAQHDEEYFYILNSADLAIPDGIGLKFAGWLIGENFRRLTGSDLVNDLLKIANERQYRIAIINRPDGLSSPEDLKKFLSDNYPKIILDAVKPDILFVTLGAPAQEKFIFHHLKDYPTVKLALGVGGAFDFLTGKIARAPRLMQILGLEWLWRVINQPKGSDQKKRLKRIYNAVIVFPWEIIKWRFIRPWFYRANVACLLYKKVNNEYYILLVERTEEPSHWQLPQGGTDGLNLEEAGIKELAEETGIKKIKILAIFKNLYKYGFKTSQRHIGYRGQKQSLMIAEFLDKEENIKINFWDHRNYKWVPADNLINEVHNLRKESAKIFLEKFKQTI